MAIEITRQTLRRAGIVLFAVYLLAGIVYSLVLAPEGRFSDEREYLALSDHLRHGPGYSMDGVHLTASRPPGYAFFVAGIQALGGGVHVVRLIQFGLVGATILLVTSWMPDEGRGPGLLVVTALAAFYPVFFYTATTVYPQTLGAFLFMLSMALLLRRPRSLLLNVATGLTASALLVAVPTFTLTLPVMLIAAWWWRGLRLMDAVAVLASAAVLVVAWTARNEIIFGQFVPFASNSGANFLIGNSENTSPSGGSGNVDRTRYNLEAHKLGLNEFEEDRFYRNAALTWIRTHPAQAAVLYLEKVANFFDVYNQFAPENKGEVSVWKQVVMGVTYGTLLALLLWRLCAWKSTPPSPHEKLFLFVFVASAFTCAIFFTRIRLRLPYDYLLVAVIASFLTRRIENFFAYHTLSVARFKKSTSTAG